MIWSILRFVSWMERKKKYWYKGKLYDLIWLCGFFCLLKMPKDIMKMFKLCGKIICIYFVLDFIIMGKCVVYRTLSVILIEKRTYQMNILQTEDAYDRMDHYMQNRCI